MRKQNRNYRRNGHHDSGRNNEADVVAGNRGIVLVTICGGRNWIKVGTIFPEGRHETTQMRGGTAFWQNVSMIRWPGRNSRPESREFFEDVKFAQSLGTGDTLCVGDNLLGEPRLEVVAGVEVRDFSHDPSPSWKRETPSS